MGAAGGFADRFVAKVEESWMERERLDVPDARPFDGATFFGGETAAGFLGLRVHVGEDFGVEVALIEGGFAAADDGGDNAGKSFEAADGADGVGVLFGDVTNFEGEFCGRGEGIATG